MEISQLHLCKNISTMMLSLDEIMEKIARINSRNCEN